MARHIDAMAEDDLRPEEALLLEPADRGEHRAPQDLVELVNLFAGVQGDPDLEPRRRLLCSPQQSRRCLEQLVKNHDAAQPSLGASIEFRDGFGRAVEGGQSSGFIFPPQQMAGGVEMIIASVAIRAVIKPDARLGADPRDRLATVAGPAVELDDRRHAVTNEAREAVAQRGLGVVG